MSYAKGSEYSRRTSPYKRYGRSVSRSSSRSRSRSRSHSSDVENPGNNLYVTGLSPRITKRDLEDHFAGEGKVVDVHLVVDPWSRESRGFGFVTMSTVEEANRCIKYLDRSVLEGRVITVEKVSCVAALHQIKIPTLQTRQHGAKRRRGRTPTPGRYLGLKSVRGRRRSPNYIPHRSPSYSSRRGRSPTPYSRSRSPSDRSRSRSYSPYRSHRPYSPPYRYYSRRTSYSPYYGRRRSYSRSRSPLYRRDRSYSPYETRDYSPSDDHYWRSYSRRRYSRRSYSRSYSPLPRRSVSSGRRSSRSYSPSVSPRARGGKNSYSSKRRYSRDSHSSWSDSRGRSVSATSRDVSRSVTPRSASPSS